MTKKDVQPQIKLNPFKKRPLNEVVKDFKNSGLYTKKFIEGLEEGLKDSSVYCKDDASNTSP